MLLEVKKAGIKEFFLILAVLVVLSTVGSFVSFVLPVYKVIGHILGIILMVIYGVLVIKRYCSVFTYSEMSEGVKIIRELGVRSKELMVVYSNIYLISRKKPEAAKIEVFTSHMLAKKTDLYIILKSDRNIAYRISDDNGAVYTLLKAKSKG